MSYAVYLEKAVWPSSLAVFYPHAATIGADIPGWKVAGAVLLLAGISFLALRERQRRPYLAVGWLWYLGTLVPVIGLGLLYEKLGRRKEAEDSFREAGRLKGQ